MSFATRQDVLDIQNEMPWEERDRPETLYQMLQQVAEAFPDRPAISYQLFSGASDPAQTLTWREFHEQVCQAANLFRSLKVEEGDVVALILPNCLETATAMVGAMVAGIASPINPLLEPENIGAILRETNAKVVVTLKSFPKTDIAQKTAEAVRHARQVHTILEIDLNAYLRPPKSWIVPFLRPKMTGKHHADIKDFVAEAGRQNTTLDFADSAGDRVGAYFHTGGTTGMPKVAQHRYSGMVYNGWLGDQLLFSEEDNIMCPLPLFHVFATHVILMAMIKSGAHVVFPTPAGYRGDGVFDNFWKLCERWKITFVITVPTAVSALMQRKVDADISSIKTAFSGSAPMPLELFKRFESACGVTICEGYGLTEATCLVSVNPPEGEKKVGSVGIPFPYTDVKITKVRDGQPVICGTDEIGEICVSNPGVYAGKTYTEEPKNVDLFHWGTHLRTGDLGRLDADGYLWITGRAKDLIIRGGHNIDPAEIEEALLGHEAVAFAGAIGQPDAHSGELPCAYVELVDGATVTEDELIEFANARIHERAAYPKYLEVLDELPKTAVGKIFKPELARKEIADVIREVAFECKVVLDSLEVVPDQTLGNVAKVKVSGEDSKLKEALDAYVFHVQY